MTAMVALLRGVNVGGKAKLAMTDLREIVAGCGFDDVRTYIQSGNVVFTAPVGADPDDVAATLATAIAAGSSVTPDVVVRTGDELAAVVDANPFLRRGEDPAHLHVSFTAVEPDLGVDDLARYAPEEAAAVGREVYLFLPNGMGRSKLAADLARRTRPAGTARNWRTVTKLLEMVGDRP